MEKYRCSIDGGCGKEDLSLHGAKVHASRMHNIKKDEFDLDTMFEVMGGEKSEPVEDPQESQEESVVPEQTPDVSEPVASVSNGSISYAVIPPTSVIEVTTTDKTGFVWRQKMNPDGSFNWEAVEACGIKMTVLERHFNNDEYLLFCRPEGSTAQWAVLESLVLNGHFTVLSVPEGTPVVDRSQFAPEPNVAASDPEMEKQVFLAEMRPILKEYAETSQTSCRAKKAFDKLKKVKREDVLDCVRNFGILNEDEKSNSAESRILYEEGYKFEAYLTNDQEVDEWSDEFAGYLAANCQDNPAYKDALYTAVDYKVVERLVNDGFITPEIIKQFCTKKLIEGQWRLRVDLDDTQK